MLTGWAAGPLVRDVVFRDKEYVFERATETLAGLLYMDAKELRSMVYRAHTHDWQADVYSLGAYSYAKVGGLGAAKELAASIDGTMFFAGEATEWQGHNGTVHGAIATGKRVAREVMKSRGKNRNSPV